MNLFVLASLSLGIASSLLAFIIFINTKRRLHLVWGFMNAAIAVFGFGTFLVGVSRNYNDAFFSWQISFCGIAYIAVFFYHTVHEFCGLKDKLFLRLTHLHGALFFLASILTTTVVHDLEFKFGQFYYFKANIAFNSFFFLWILIVVKAFVHLYQQWINSKGLKRIQCEYLIYGMLIGFVSGATTAIPSYGINFYPGWHFFVCVYAAIQTYALFRYQVLDIKIVVTRVAIFIFVYTLILGIPIWVGFQLLGKGLWLIPMGMMGWFAVAGPFIYFYIQKRAEDRLLKEQKSYQATLRKASAGMGRIKDLKKLLNLIVFILTRSVRLEHSVIYIYDEPKKIYKLGALKLRSSRSSFIAQISEKSFLISYLKEHHNSIIFEEIKQKALDYKDPMLTSVENEIEEVKAALIVPIYIDSRLFAFVAMGKKESGKLFSEDDLAVFTILASQAALAIENAKFYEDMKITQQQLFQAEKMATIGTMADGLSHQINNRFHALGFIAGDALDTINLSKHLEMTDKIKDVLKDLERAFNRVQDNVKQGGEVVQGLLRYTRKGQDGFVPTDVDAVISNAYEMAQFKIKTSQMSLVRKYDINTLPKVKGNSTQLQEVFFNLIDNGYDAMMQRKNDLKEEGYHPILNIYAKIQGENLEMIFEDNGIGVKDEDSTKLFTPFFTTKLSSKKGTGLGLYVIRKIIEDNHKGKVEFSSKYMQGTQMKLLLPLSFEGGQSNV